MPYQVVYSITLVVAILMGCSQSKSSKSDKASDDANKADQPMTPETPSTTTTPTETVATDPDVEDPACWNKLLSSTEAAACSTMFAHSSRTCVAGLPKEASCTRDLINSKYGSATLNGQPAMTVIDQWIADGYQPNQCSMGSDGKLYVYFLKKTFTPKSASTDGQQRYTFADKKLGPSGSILNSIVLTTGAANSLKCD